MTDVEISGESHVNISMMNVSLLDRIWFLCPKSVSPQVDVKAHCIGDPVNTYARGMSDHCPVAVVLAAKSAVRTLPCSIPKYVSSSKEFQETVTTYLSALQLEDAPIQQAIPLAKEAIHNAAQITRERFLEQEDARIGTTLDRLATISKCVFRNCMSQACVLLKRSPLAEQHLKVSNGYVELYDPAAFEREFLEQEIPP